VSVPVVEVRRVAFAYPGSARRGERPFALADVSFDVGAGEVLGVVGPNSAGKTTLVRLLTNVLRPDAGEIRIEGAPLARLRAADLARRVAVVPQELPQGFAFSVEELVLMGRYPHAPGRFFESAEDRLAAQEAMLATGVRHLGRVPLERLSGGERQRAVLARALAQRPRLLLLDEPTAHLDLRYQATTAALLRRLADAGVAVMLVSHDLNLAAELCDRLLLMADGRVVGVGAPADVLDPATLEAVFGCAVHVDTSPSTGRPLVHVAWSEHVRAAAAHLDVPGGR
jgi:iron complex transport system ATP-binding protein